MGRKLRRLVGALQPNPSPLSPSAARLAVLRATSPRRPSSPPRPHHISSLLSFGRAARPSASALSSSLSSRLLSTTNPSVALKSLLALHHLLLAAPFILLDSLSSSLLPASSGRHTRSPLLLSSFPLGPDPLSWSLSSSVRWYSRLLELRLLLPQPSHDVTQWVSSLVDRDLIAELEIFANFFAAASSPPEISVGNRLLDEVGRMVREDRVTAEEGILVRVREVRERTGGVGFGDAVELVLLLRRIEENGPVEPSRFRGEVREVREVVEGVVLGREKEARRVRREGMGSVSERFGARTGEVVLFGSNRWVKP